MGCILFCSLVSTSELKFDLNSDDGLYVCLCTVYICLEVEESVLINQPKSFENVKLLFSPFWQPYKLKTNNCLYLKLINNKLKNMRSSKQSFQTIVGNQNSKKKKKSKKSLTKHTNTDITICLVLLLSHSSCNGIIRIVCTDHISSK